MKSNNRNFHVPVSYTHLYEEAGSPKELGDLMGALRLVEDTKLKKDQNKMDYYEANKELFEKFTEKTLRGE